MQSLFHTIRIRYVMKGKNKSLIALRWNLNTLILMMRLLWQWKLTLWIFLFWKIWKLNSKLNSIQYFLKDALIKVVFPNLATTWWTWHHGPSNRTFTTSSKVRIKAQEVHSIVKLNITCEKKKSTFSKLHHQNGSKFYQFFFMSRYTQYLLHSKKW